MKITFLSFIVFISIFMLACSGSSERSGGELDGVVLKDSLVKQQVLDQDLGLEPYVVGPYLLVKQGQEREDGAVFTVYDLDDLEYLGVVGRRDREAPNGFYGVNYSGQYFSRNGEYFIWVNDPPRFRLSLVNVTESLELNKTVIERHISHEPENDFMNTLYVVDSSYLVGHQPGYHQNTNLAPLVMKKGDLIQGFGEYPKVKNVLDERRWRNGATFNRVSLSMRPNQSHFAVAMDHYDRLDIYDKEGRLTASYRDPERYSLYDYSDIVSPSVDIARKYNDFYAFSTATQDFLFALYYGIPVEKTKEFNASTIRVFDWNGNLKAELVCPDDVWTLSIDEENGFIYAGSVEQEAIFRYNIKSILRNIKE